MFLNTSLLSAWLLRQGSFSRIFLATCKALWGFPSYLHPFLKGTGTLGLRTPNSYKTPSALPGFPDGVNYKTMRSGMKCPDEGCKTFWGKCHIFNNNKKSLKCIISGNRCLNKLTNYSLSEHSWSLTCVYKAVTISSKASWTKYSGIKIKLHLQTYHYLSQILSGKLVFDVMPHV